MDLSSFIPPILRNFRASASAAPSVPAISDLGNAVKTVTPALTSASAEAIDAGFVKQALDKIAPYMASGRIRDHLAQSLARNIQSGDLKHVEQVVGQLKAKATRAALASKVAARKAAAKPAKIKAVDDDEEGDEDEGSDSDEATRDVIKILEGIIADLKKDLPEGDDDDAGEEEEARARKLIKSGNLLAGAKLLAKRGIALEQKINKAKAKVKGLAHSRARAVEEINSRFSPKPIKGVGATAKDRAIDAINRQFGIK